MSNYSQIYDYSAKDSLTHGDPLKIIYGAQIDEELSAIATAIASKQNNVITSRGDIIRGGSGGLAERLALSFAGYVVASNGTDAIFAPVMPPNTAAIFMQTAAPTGWTKSVAHHDKVLRVVSGTVGSGGATAFSSVFGAGKTTGSTTLTAAQSGLVEHVHKEFLSATSGTPLSGFQAPTSAGTYGGDNEYTITSGSGSADVGKSSGAYNDSGSAIGGTDASSGHTHTLSLDLYYVDVIVCTKNTY